MTDETVRTSLIREAALMMARIWCQHFRPVVPRNASSELAVLWMYGRYTTFTDYFTVIKSDPQY